MIALNKILENKDCLQMIPRLNEKKIDNSTVRYKWNNNKDEIIKLDKSINNSIIWKNNTDKDSIRVHVGGNYKIYINN